MTCCALALLAVIGLLLPADLWAQEVPEAEERVQEAAERVQEGEAASPDRSVRIVFEGRSGGVGSGSIDLRLDRGLGELGLELTEAGLSAFRRGSRVLYRGGATVSGLSAFLMAGNHEAEELGDQCFWSNDELLVFAPQEPCPDLPLLELEGMAQRQGRLSRWSAPGQEPWWALEEDPERADDPLETDPSAWEVEVRTAREGVLGGLGLDAEGGAPVALTVVGRRVGEGTRRLRRARELAEGQPSLFLAAGNAVEGRSFVTGQRLSLHRPVAWDGLKEAGLSTLVPAGSELLAGVEELTHEAAVRGITLLSANLVDAEGEALFTPWQRVGLDGLSILLVGYTPVGELARLPAELRDTIHLAPAAEALGGALLAATAQGGRPDLTVLVSSARRELPQLVDAARGFDVVVGNWEGVEEGHVWAVEVDPEMERLGAAPLLITRSAPDRLGVLDIGFRPEDGEVHSLRYRSERIRESLPTDDALLRRVMAIRQRVYRAGEGVLIPDQGQLSPERWAWLSANAARHQLLADAAFLPRPPWPFSVAGPTLDLYAEAYLSTVEELWLYTLPGSILQKLARGVGGLAGGSGEMSVTEATASGAAEEVYFAGVSADGVWVEGRRLDKSEMYRVVLSERVAGLPTVATLLRRHSPAKRFVGRGRAAPGGAPVLLRDVVLAELQQLREQHTGFGQQHQRRIDWLLEQGGTEPRSLFLAEVEDLALGVTLLGVVNQEDYEDNPESRITQSDYFQIHLRFRGSMGLWGRDVAWSIGAEADFALRREDITPGDEGQEGDEENVDIEDLDDLELYTEVLLRRIALPAAVPYVRVSFDTEFTPEEGSDGEKNPRQEVLRIAAGLTSRYHPRIKLLRAALFFQADLAPLLFDEPDTRVSLWERRNPFEEPDGRYEAGFTAAFTHQLKNVDRGLTWTNAATFDIYFWPLPNYDPGNLFWRTTWRTELSVRLVQQLRLNTYLDVWAFQGADPASRAPGVSLQTGLGLSWSGIGRLRLN